MAIFASRQPSFCAKTTLQGRKKYAIIHQKKKQKRKAGGELLKEQLEKRLKKVCDSIGTQAAAEKFDSLSQSIEAEYDKRVAGGMSELDAYKEMLRDIDAIEDLLRDMKKTEEEEEQERNRKTWKKWKKKLDAIEGSVQGIWWLCTVIFYFFVSITFGHWHMTWLLFLTGSIGSIIIEMLFQYNKGVPKKKILENLHGILWLAIVVVYFGVSFLFGGWAYTWLIFVFGALVEVIADAVKKIIN